MESPLFNVTLVDCLFGKAEIVFCTLSSCVCVFLLCPLSASLPSPSPVSSGRPPGFIPVCSLGLAQVGRMNLGKDASTFKYYTMCGLQEGFEPFAVNMNREVTMWFSKRLPTFYNVPKDHNHIAV